MGDATEENFELNEEGPVDSQEPLTAGYKDEVYSVKVSQKDRKKDIRSFCLSVFNLMNAILGSGILGLAETMKNLGVALFYVLLVMTACLAGYTINLLLVTSKHCGETSYEGMAVKSFGNVGKIVTSVMIVFHCLGAMCSYVFIIKEEMPELVKILIDPSYILTDHTTDEGPFYLKGWFLMILVVVFVIAPLSALKNIRFLGYSSAFGMSCMLLFTFTVILKKFSIPCPLNVTASEHTNDSMAHNHSIEDEQVCEAEIATVTSKSAYAVPTMIFAFMCHASMLPIYQELRRPSTKKMRKVAGVSIFLVFAIYTASATFGYLTFYNRVRSELLLTYSEASPSDPLIILSRVMVLICVTLSTPLLHYPCRKTIITTFFRNGHVFSWFRHISVMLACLSLTVVLVVCIPDIRDIFGLAGATSSTSLLIIFPCAFFLKLTDVNKTGKTKRIGIMILMTFGVIFMILSVALIIADWVTMEH